MDLTVGNKQEKPKENTPDLLMTIVRRLLFSSDMGQREQEKARLEKQFQESDRRLDGLIADHVSDLLLVSQAFSTISTRIAASQERIRTVRESLQSCKNLLHCKRDELRRLWIEGVEMKTEYAALDAVERVTDVADRLPSLIAARSYLTATELVVASLALLESELADVEALQQIKAELIVKKEELNDRLIDELHKQIYVRPTAVIFRGFQRNGSQRRSRDRGPLSSHAKSRNVAADENWAVDEMAFKLLVEADVSSISSSTRPVMDLTDPDSNPVMFIAVLVQSLSNLRRLPDAVDVLRSRVHPGLIAFVQRASQHVADGACIEDSGASGPIQPQLLLELFELVFRQSRVVAKAHSIVLANMHRVKNSTSSLGDFCMYDITEIWNKIQGVFQLLLTDYLDIHNTAAGCQSIQTTSLDDEAVDISSYFLRKRPTKLKKFALFRFDASSHALSMTSYIREQRHELCESGHLVIGNADIGNEHEGEGIIFVCRCSAANITTIYNPLQKFLQDVAEETNAVPGSLSLQVFIREFVRNIYLGQLSLTIESNIAQVTKGFDTRRSLIDLHTQRELGVSKPLLKSTVVVARSIQELCDRMQDLPDYAVQFVNMICKILQDFLDTCHTAYQDCVKTYSDDKKVLSASWVKDDDINRFLRSLPNWLNLKAATASSSSSSAVADDEPEDQVMSEDELRLMNSKESSILTSNLSNTESHVSNAEIIADVTLLKALGHLCESMEWFSRRIDDLASSLSSGGSAYILPQPEGSSHNGNISNSHATVSPTPFVLPASESTITTLSSLARHFADISELCILVLHLEVRMHCFHHLLAIAHGQNTDYHGVIDKMEPDENVTRLNKDLAAIEDVMQQSVQPRKFRYIFEGLGHLVSTILINSAQFLRRINENGIKKMCRNIFAIQQCLTNVTSNRESDLDHARQYYELLYLPTDDIVKAVVDRGRQFTEHEYTILLSLSHRSEYGSKDDEHAARMSKFRTILTEHAL